MRHMLEESAIDPTYTEDFLLTYRAFTNDPEWICSKLLEWFDNGMFRDKVILIKRKFVLGIIFYRQNNPNFSRNVSS